MHSKQGLTDTLELILQETEGHEIRFSDLARALKYRGFGTLMVGPALIAVLPTGAIPGIPSLCALFIILIAGQSALGQKSPWLPRQLKELAFDRETCRKTLKKARPWTDRIDRLFQPRLPFLVEEPAPRLIACLCVILALAMIPLELVPFAAAIPAFAILLLGLSLSVRDGLITAIALALSAFALYAVPVWLIQA